MYHGGASHADLSSVVDGLALIHSDSSCAIIEITAKGTNDGSGS